MQMKLNRGMEEYNMSSDIYLEGAETWNVLVRKSFGRYQNILRIKAHVDEQHIQDRYTILL